MGVTHVDTSGDTPSREGNDLKGGEIWLSEGLDLKVGPPWKILDQLRGVVDQLLVLRAHLLVNNGNETYMVAVILSRTEQ